MEVLPGSLRFPGMQTEADLIAELVQHLQRQLSELEAKLAQAEADKAKLKEALAWYVENDETYEGGHWEDANAFWLEGKRRAEALLK